MRKNIVFSILGTTMDSVSKSKGRFEKRWDKWRPTISIGQNPEILKVDELVLLCTEREEALANELKSDFLSINPDSVVSTQYMDFNDPWDFLSTYMEFTDKIESYEFDRANNYHFHINTGSHVQQIVIYVLSQSRVFPGTLLQTSPPNSPKAKLSPEVINLDLPSYDALAQRINHAKEVVEEFLKSGIHTHNAAFNQLIAQIEKVATKTKAPMLITGPTGAGKSALAAKIFELKKLRNLMEGDFVETNCATLIGENAMSTLFGHKKGAFTGAVEKRDGLLKRADGGFLFLDEIGDLSLDGQTKLLRAVEDKKFLPLGGDKEEESNFQLIAGTNRDLRVEVAKGNFRADLFARINLWTYRLPGLAERKEDIEPNIDYELGRFFKENGSRVSFNADARKRYLSFALSPQAIWTANFRDLYASITRMATLCESGRIRIDDVANEIATLKYLWAQEVGNLPGDNVNLEDYMPAEQFEGLDYIDRVELSTIIKVCIESNNGAEAARTLYDKSRLKNKTVNDSRQMQRALEKYDMKFDSIKARHAQLTRL